MKLKHERGAAAVEFAFVSGLLVMLLLGICDFGFMFYQQGTLASAAREGARYYAIHNLDANAADSAKSAVVAAAPGLGLTAANVTITACPAAIPTAPPYPQTTVSVEKSYGGITGFFSGIFTSSFKLKATGVMRCGG